VNDTSPTDGAPTVITPTGVIAKVWALLGPTERRQLVLLVPAVVLMAVLETAGVASIVPFLGLLSDPEIINRNVWLRSAYDIGGFASRDSFFFVVGLGVLGLVTVGNSVSALTTWALLRFSWMRSHTLSTRLLRSYLRQPYTFFLGKNSSELGKNLLAEVQSVVGGVMIQGLNLGARIVVLLFVSVALFALDPVMAVGVVALFGGVYGALFLVVRRTVMLRGRERLKVNQVRFKIAQEALAGVKEIKLYGLERVVEREFSAASERMATLSSLNAVTAQLPKYAIETLAFTGVLLMVMHLLRDGRRLEHVLPVLGLYAFAAYRMLPALQTIFAGLTQLRFNIGALDMLYNDIVTCAAQEEPMPESTTEIPFVDAIELRGVSFRYAGATRQTLEQVDLRIGPGDWFAFVGPTGAGKSTLVDVVLGLLVPDDGIVLVDGLALVGNVRHAWQQNVAYVPQQIFLADDTVVRNIAFGLPDASIDRERAMAAARIAQIHDFIVGELAAGYDTPIGERGVRLSGGQRQRIGIARALYRRPRLLVLDEATSALDNATEAAFFSALEVALGECAVISIAHRLSTTRSFDRICVVEQGRIVDTGTYGELEARNRHFQTSIQEAA
jgi:ABC-type multidrug transport system fused ATPase/permease subunit